jgi:AcrR family transcriptional regulator
MSPSSPPSDGRRRQARGQRRIASILDVAEAVIAEVGYDAATTNLIAARAGMSPGSLYQFFANKPAIVEALADRYVAELAAADLADPQLADLPIDRLVDHVVDPVITFHLAHPAAKSLLARRDAIPDLLHATSRLHDVLCDNIERILGGIAPTRSPRDRRLSALTTFEIFGAMLPVVATTTPRERPRTVRELKAVLVGYWSNLAETKRRHPTK